MTRSSYHADRAEAHRLAKVVTRHLEEGSLARACTTAEQLVDSARRAAAAQVDLASTNDGNDRLGAATRWARADERMRRRRRVCTTA